MHIVEIQRYICLISVREAGKAVHVSLERQVFQRLLSRFGCRTQNNDVVSLGFAQVLIHRFLSGIHKDQFRPGFLRQRPQILPYLIQPRLRQLRDHYFLRPVGYTFFYVHQTQRSRPNVPGRTALEDLTFCSVPIV